MEYFLGAPVTVDTPARMAHGKIATFVFLVRDVAARRFFLHLRTVAASMQ